MVCNGKMSVSMIKKTLGIVAVLAGTTFLTSCATLSKEECLTADWYIIGFEDGSKGLPMTRIGEHRQACADHGVSPNMDRYGKGRHEGLYNYCVPNVGFNLGKRGAAYNPVCELHDEASFKHAYLDGMEVFHAEKEVKAISAELQKNQDEIAHLDEEIKLAEATIISPKSTAIERAHTLVRIKELQEQMNHLQYDSDVLHSRLRKATHRAEYLQAQLGQQYTLSR